MKARDSDRKASEYIRQATPYMSPHRTESHRLVPKDSALLIIDMQGLFLNKSSHSYLKDSEGIIGNVQALLEAFRESGLPIIFTRHALRPAEKAGAMGRWWADVTRDGTEAAVIDSRIAPRRGEKVIRKTRYSAFVRTDLERYLRGRSISSLVITGVMTHLCCDSTARDAFMRDLDVFLVVDGTASKTEDLHVSSIKALADGFAIPVKTSEVISCLTRK